MKKGARAPFGCTGAENFTLGARGQLELTNMALSAHMNWPADQARVHDAICGSQCCQMLSGQCRCTMRHLLTHCPEPAADVQAVRAPPPNIESCCQRPRTGHP